MADYTLKKKKSQFQFKFRFGSCSRSEIVSHFKAEISCKPLLLQGVFDRFITLRQKQSSSSSSFRKPSTFFQQSPCLCFSAQSSSCGIYNYFFAEVAILDLHEVVNSAGEEAVVWGPNLVNREDAGQVQTHISGWQPGWSLILVEKHSFCHLPTSLFDFL